MLIDSSMLDPLQSLHLHMVSSERNALGVPVLLAKCNGLPYKITLFL